MPVAAFAVDTLVNSVGKMIVKMHGFPDYPYVAIPAPFIEGVMIPQREYEEKIQNAVDDAVTLLTGGAQG